MHLHALFLFLTFACVNGFHYASSASGFIELITNSSSILSPDVCSNDDFPPKFVLPSKKRKTPEANITSTVTPAAEERPMATFDEWTKERLKKKPRVMKLDLGTQASNGHTRMPGEDPSGNFREARINSGPASDSHPQRNYASRECGAKVLYSNPEMQNRGAVLNDKERDQYLRNPCQAAKNKFLIVELCETIQVTRFQIANYELFSSGPQDFRVSVAERSPTAEWVSIGEFKAGDNRDLQTFTVVNNGVYSKFIRIELLTHYGSEHYCTLSVLRAYGISMVDEYEAEALSSVVDPEPVVVQPPVVPEPPQSKPEADVDNSSSDNIVNKVVVGTIGGLKSALKSALSWHSFGSAEVRDISRPKLLEQCWTCSTRKKRETRWLCYVFAKHFIPTPLKMGRYRKSFSKETAQSRFLKIVTFSRQCKADAAAVRVPNQRTVPASTPPTRQVFIPKEDDSPLPASSTNHKESVFLKLNKRITTLELNMSLSSEYLSELSRRYVQQTEDIKKQQERMLKGSEEAAIKVVQEARSSFLSEIKQLKTQIAALTKNLENLRHATVTTVEVARRVATTSEEAPDTEDDCDIDDENEEIQSTYGLHATVTTVEVARRVATTSEEAPDTEDDCDIDDENEECGTLSSEPPLDYFQNPEHLWTTGQLICVVIVLQACSVFVFYVFSGLQGVNAREMTRIKRLEETVMGLTQPPPEAPKAEVLKSIELANPTTGLSANQRKRLRKKLKQQQKKQEDWDNASSLAASTTTGTTCHSDRSGDEIENLDPSGWNVVRRYKKS
uniref:SUN domain-containing protein n=1 Tax=Steinernema glaseri TaxID=37863 RepID=A0A1I7YM63_9BILA